MERASMTFLVCSDARQTKYSIYCLSKLRRKDKCALLCFRRLSWAKHWIYYLLELHGRPIPAKYSIYSLLRLWRKDKCGTIMFSKAKPSKTLPVLCVSNTQPSKVWNWFRKLHQAKHRIYSAFLCFWNRHRAYIIWAFVFEDPAQQSIAFTVFWDSEGKISVALLCFRRLSRAKYCICYVSEASALQHIAFTMILKAQVFLHY